MRTLDQSGRIIDVVFLSGERVGTLEAISSNVRTHGRQDRAALQA
jgi:hypothetical protein